MILGRGGQVFFGTVKEAVQYFAQLGHPVPDGQTPSDHFLQVTEGTLGSKTSDTEVDLPVRFQQSLNGSVLHKLVDQAAQVTSCGV